ncbi:hypothetical protein BJY14_006044 [Actinomadura luteofluorescens]|uniref:Uncharacterized protein n=1 Tax=Actinomadura luteofluorescens TaxID=46163 RepID=A0A7Y9JIQ2_9ACTN|nr:hypothetical protein [Actinomadura luteofluorescens]
MKRLFTKKRLLTVTATAAAFSLIIAGEASAATLVHMT